MNIEEKALELYPIKEKFNKKATGTYDPNFPRRKAFIEGYKQALKSELPNGDLVKSEDDINTCPLPKFTTGDFVKHRMYDGKIYEVVDVRTDNTYSLECANSRCLDDIKSASECNLSLWKFEDAKDGDVLQCLINGEAYIIVFKEIKDGFVSTRLHYIFQHDIFCTQPTELFCRSYEGKFQPCSREQFESFFLRLSETGLKWDDVNKVLKIKTANGFKIGDRIRKKGTTVQGDIIKNIYRESNGTLMFEFNNSDDAPVYDAWELVCENAWLHQRLGELVDDALSKETKESWNAFLDTMHSNSSPDMTEFEQSLARMFWVAYNYDDARGKDSPERVDDIKNIRTNANILIGFAKKQIASGIDVHYMLEKFKKEVMGDRIYNTWETLESISTEYYKKGIMDTISMILRQEE